MVTACIELASSVALSAEEARTLESLVQGLRVQDRRGGLGVEEFSVGLCESV